MKTYLVTGGAGFIGSNFILMMLRKYDDIRIVNLDTLTYAGNLENLKSLEGDRRHIFVQADIADKNSVEKLFERYDCGCVVNFAAESHVDRSIADPGIFVQTNIIGTLNLLNCSKAHWRTGDNRYRPGVKFVQISTDEVYGSLGTDGCFTETTPQNPHSPYSASKASADMFVRAYGDTYQLPYNITRCSNNYGPYQFPEKLIPLVINNALQHKPLPVYGDGLNVRDWIYVEDHCLAVDAVIQEGVVGEIYNIGSRSEKTNIDMIKMIVGYLHDHVDAAIGEHLITFVEDRKGHDKRYAMDPAKISRELGWTPKTPLTEGIPKTIQWIIENKDWMARVTSGEYQKYYDTMYNGK